LERKKKNFISVLTVKPCKSLCRQLDTDGEKNANIDIKKKGTSTGNWFRMVIAVKLTFKGQIQVGRYNKRFLKYSLFLPTVTKTVIASICYYALSLFNLPPPPHHHNQSTTFFVFFVVCFEPIFCYLKLSTQCFIYNF
jgi:hypothetical protein